MFGPLSWSRRLISVRGALGSGTDTSTGAYDAPPFTTAAAMMLWKCVVLLMLGSLIAPHQVKHGRTYPTLLSLSSTHHLTCKPIEKFRTFIQLLWMKPT